MMPSIPVPQDFDVSLQTGFLPPECPVEVLSNCYYDAWEAIGHNLQGLILSRRLREVVDRLPVLSIEHLATGGELRRAYSLLAFLTHAYIWGGDAPAEVVPPPISIPFLALCRRLELPPVATYAAVALWNYRPLFADEPVDRLENLATLLTYTGSLDESWFYLVTIAIEARGAPVIGLVLDAFQAVRDGDAHGVTLALQAFAERLDDLGSLLLRMYESCDPHIFYHRIRPFLAGGKNMAEAGLPRGVTFDDGSGHSTPVHCSGGSAAQSSLIQFFDLALGVQHHPTGTQRSRQARHRVDDVSSSDSESHSGATSPTVPPPQHNFLAEMREYMPGPHRRFLERVAQVANIRDFVEARRSDVLLRTAYDACLAMLRAFRDKHIQIVTRYIITKSREQADRHMSPKRVPGSSPPVVRRVNIANGRHNGDGAGDGAITAAKKNLRGTGGTALIPFLKQARDETGDPAIGSWARRILSNSGGAHSSTFTPLGGVAERGDGRMEVVGLAGIWSVDDSEGGICHW